MYLIEVLFCVLIQWPNFFLSYQPNKGSDHVLRSLSFLPTLPTCIKRSDQCPSFFVFFSLHPSSFPPPLLLPPQRLGNRYCLNAALLLLLLFSSLPLQVSS